MTTDDLAKYYGSPGEAQRALSVSRQLWRNWLLNGIPPGRQAEIQIATDSAVKAGSRRPARRARK